MFSQDIIHVVGRREIIRICKEFERMFSTFLMYLKIFLRRLYLNKQVEITQHEPSKKRINDAVNEPLAISNSCTTIYSLEICAMNAK